MANPGINDILYDIEALQSSVNGPGSSTKQISLKEKKMQPGQQKSVKQKTKPPKKQTAALKDPVSSMESAGGNVSMDETNGFQNMASRYLCVHGFLVLLSWFGISIAMIVIGAIHHNECPFDGFINVYPFCAGAIALGIIILFLIQLCSSEKERNDFYKDNESGKIIGLGVLIYIGGSIYVYVKAGGASHDVNDDDYCNPLVLAVSVWGTASVYILAGVGLLLGLIKWLYWP